jgi:hypothetical protein
MPEGVWNDQGLEAHALILKSYNASQSSCGSTSSKRTDINQCVKMINTTDGIIAIVIMV